MFRGIEADASKKAFGAEASFYVSNAPFVQAQQKSVFAITVKFCYNKISEEFYGKIIIYR